MKLGLPSFLTFASAFLYHMYLQWGQHPFSIMEATRHFQPGKGPSRGLLCDCEIFGYLRITFVSSSNRYIVTGQTILHYCARKINYFARQLTIVVERIVSGKAVKQQANTIVPLINWVAGAAAGRSYAYIIKTVMVTSVLTWNHCSMPMFPVTFTILFGLFQKAPDAQLKVIMYGPGSGLSLTPGHLLVILSILVQISSRLSSSSSNRWT